MKRKRPVLIPLRMCKDVKDITSDKHIEYINFYKTRIENNDYLIDIYKTSDMMFYVQMFNITDDNYEQVDFNEFKRKHMQPSLYDFFDI